MPPRRSPSYHRFRGPTPAETRFLVGSDGLRAFDLADQDTDELFELYASPLPKLKERRAR